MHNKISTTNQHPRGFGAKRLGGRHGDGRIGDTLVKKERVEYVAQMGKHEVRRKERDKGKTFEKHALSCEQKGLGKKRKAPI